MLHDIAMAFIFFGSALCFLMAIEQVTGKDIGRLNVLSFSLLCCNGIIIMGVGLSVSLYQVAHPNSGFPFFPALFAAGPLNLFYYHSLLDSELPLSYKIKLHILPAVFMLGASTVLLSQPLAFKQQLIADMFANPLSSPLSILVALGWTHVTSYLTYLFTLELSLWNRDEIRSEVRIIALTNLMAITSTVLLGVGFACKLLPLTIAGAAMLTLIHMIIFLSHHRYPHFFQSLKREIKQKRYEKTLLAGVNTELIYARLMELMNEEKLYADMELNLKGTAGLLGVTPHQLSQFLNEHLNMDFRNFVNRFRVEEAQRLLKADPDMGILTICFEVGFNSKSTFNAAFKKQTGMTPREYRMNSLDGSS
jgi:AraC-like DNA-binding protein